VNEEQIRKLFPQASADFIRKNFGDVVEGAWEDASTQPASRDGTLAESQAQETNPVGFFIRITSVRKRLADWDGIVGKYHTDCIRYAGIIPNDDPTTAFIQTTQRKAEKGEEEHTLIEVYKWNPS